MKTFKDYLEEKRGLWDNIHAKRARIKNGSGERMRKPGSKGAPSEADLKAANEETEIEEATPYYNKPSFLKKMSRAAKQEQQAREKKEAEAKKPVKEELSNDDKSSIALRALVAKKNLKQAEGKKMSADFYKKMNDRVDAGKKLNKLHQEQSRDELEEQFDLIEEFEEVFSMLEEAAKAVDRGEYDYEGQMARTQLQTVLRNSKDLIDMLSDDDNMPEWVQSKITLAQDYISSVRDYMQSRDELEEQFDLIEEYVEDLSLEHDIHADSIWEKLEAITDEELLEYAIDAKGHKSSTGGLTQKGVDAYNAKTGGNLQTAVTTPPSKLKPGSKAANRRKSFCARMGGVDGPMKKPNGEPSRKALALRKWNC